MTRATRTLLLAGHGSSFDAESAASVFAHAARVRARGVFDAVHVAFWKQEPHLSRAVARIRTDQTFVVPMFMAEGYFTREVVPRVLGRRAGMRICRPVGAHERMSELVLQCAHATGVSGREAALALVGHGTERSATSAATVERITRELRGHAAYGEVACGFLDQRPRIEDVVAGFRTPRVVVVPYFMADGYHARTTLPGALSRVPDRELLYTPAVGTLPEIAELVIQLTGEAMQVGAVGV